MLKLEKMSVFKLLIYDIRLSPELLLPYMGPESESSLRSRYFRKCHMNFKLLPRNFYTSSLLKQNSVVKFVDKVNPFQDGSFSCCLRMGAKSCFNKEGYNFDGVSKNGYLIKIKVFWNIGYDVRTSALDVTNKILSGQSNYIVDVIM